jgi:hypothetical protein
MPAVAELQSRVLFSPADEMLGSAIAETLEAPPAARAGLFTRLVEEILHFVRENPGERDWSCAFHTGVDDSAIFRGGHGHSLVIDPAGRLWRARSYEDFETTYAFSGTSCEIATLTPLYAQMSEYRPR